MRFADDLEARLLRGARGLYSEEAAVCLLIGHGMWLRRDAFVRACVEVDGEPGDEVAFVDWPAAIGALNTGDLPCSTSEAAMLRIAACLAGIAADLRTLLGGLDARNIRLVAQAVLHANGTPHAVVTLPEPSRFPPGLPDADRERGQR
jgi:hypothetical protein